MYFGAERFYEAVFVSGCASPYGRMCLPVRQADELDWQHIKLN